MSTRQKYFFTFLASLASLAGEAEAVNFNDYKTHFTTTYLKPLAKDLGALMGAGTFSRASLLGFPALNVEGEVILLGGGESTLLKGMTYGLPFAKVEIGLPVVGIDVQARGMMYDNLTIVGAGVKYLLPLFPSLPATPTPSVAVVATYHQLTFGSGTDQLTGSVVSVNGVASYSFPGVPVEPYIGAGMDFTSLAAKLLNQIDLPVSETGLRYCGGLNISIFPLIYATGEIGIANATTSYGVKVGLKLP